MITSTGIAPLRADRLFLLMASVFTVSMGYGVVLPVLPYWLDRLADGVPGLSVSWHTGLTGVYMLTLFAFAPCGGAPPTAWAAGR